MEENEEITPERLFNAMKMEQKKQEVLNLIEEDTNRYINALAKHIVDNGADMEVMKALVSIKSILDLLIETDRRNDAIFREMMEDMEDHIIRGE